MPKTQSDVGQDGAGRKTRRPAAIDRLRDVVVQLQLKGVALEPRALVLFVTKLDEARMWADRAIELGNKIRIGV
jgi:hypothetical protein